MESDIMSLDIDGNLIVTSRMDYWYGVDGDLRDKHDIICDWVDELPKNGHFIQVYTGYGDFSSWEVYGNTGIYAYDEVIPNADGSPRLICRPSNPLTIDDIPLEIVKLLEIFSNTAYPPSNY